MAVFLNFNLMAAIGNFVAGFIRIVCFFHLPNSNDSFQPAKLLIIPVVLRLLFIPFFMFCPYDMGYRKFHPIFTSPWWFIIANTVMSFTSGYFSSLGMMYAPG